MIVNILEISAAQCFAVRHPVLRQGKPLESCAFDDDNAESTVHFGLFTDKKLAGVASVFSNSSPLFDEKIQFQLRGMAVLAEMQGLRLGEKLLKRAAEYSVNKHGEILWFNAREIAFGFYEKFGYCRVGKIFEIENVGSHSVMFKKL